MPNLDSKAIQQRSLQWRLSRRFKARSQGGSSPNAIWQALTPLIAMGVLSLPTPVAAQSPLYWSGSGSWDASGTNWTSFEGSPPSEAWSGAVGVFVGDAGGDVTVEQPVGFEILQFAGKRYTIRGEALTMNASSGSAELKVNEGVTATIGSALVDGSASRLRKTGLGTLVLTGYNQYTGGTTVDAGTLRADSDTALVQDTAYAITTGATLDLNSYSLQASSLTGGGTVIVGAGDLTVSTNTRSVFDGQLQGEGALNKIGDGSLALNGVSSMSGGVHLIQGRIDLGNAQGLGNGTLSMYAGTTLGFAVNGLVIENALQLNSSQDPTIDTGTYDGTWAGVIGGDGSLSKMGTGRLTLTSNENHYNGVTEVRQGTLRAGAANTFSPYSAHNVAAGATLDLAGYDQTLSRLNNSGSVQLSGASGTPGTVLKITGAYEGDGGKLGIATVLNGNGSASDRLLLSGPDAVASGNTTVQVTNVGGLGAPTTGNGIEIISTEDGGRLQSGAFTLAGGHVDAGAYEYRLLQTEQGASLQSTFVQLPDTGTSAPTDTSTPAPVSVPVPVPAYRVEVPLISALPAQLRQADMAMLGDMRKRVGDEMGRTDGGRRTWGRILRTDPRIRQQGTVNPQSSGHLNGFQAGLDLYADPGVTAGLYVGQLEGSLAVNGFASGVEGKAVGFNRLQSRYLGLYGSWQSDTGVYADSVVQWAGYRSHLHTGDSTATTKGSGWLASLEVGKPVAVNSHWQIEPQAQLIYRQMRLDDTVLGGTNVQHSTPSDWTLRLGLRIKGSLATRAGVLQPYGRINVYKASRTTDVARFITPAASTDIQARGGYTSSELAAGATLQLNQRTSFYGELGRLWANGGETRVKSGLQASVGVKVRW